jgi:UDP-N-acetylmuramoylalanine--D-glutamate ligase
MTMRRLHGTGNDFAGLDVLIVGLGREGTALARCLASRGARVTVTDIKPAEELGESVAALSGMSITFALGGHPLTLLDGMDILYTSPGVPLETALLVEARHRNIPLSSEPRLFATQCPAPIAGITGSSGKTTCTALVGEMLKAAGKRTWVGGNIGQPLIGYLDEIDPADSVVMELSSFQLEFFGPWPSAPADSRAARTMGPAGGWSPPIAAILNITPNHLDRHASMDAYVAAKLNILDYQKRDDTAVLGLDNPATRKIGEKDTMRQRVLWFSQEDRVDEGAFLRGSELALRLRGREEAVCSMGELKLLGRHNVANALAACAIAAAAGAPVDALRRAATTFRGVEHRLELIRERGNVRWYNDSIATTPERTVAALQAFSAPVVLLAGGRDKHLPWQAMADLTWKKARHLILFGEAAALIERAMSASPARQNSCRVHRVGTMEQAVELAARVALPGDVVLLSPGGTSFDSYLDFVARGEHFRQLVGKLE